MITVGTDVASSQQAVATAGDHEGVWAVVGIHPNSAAEATTANLDAIDELAKDPVVVGIGETGLDYYRDHTTPARQEESFRAHIGLARTHDKALVIHCRDAWDQCLAILSAGAPPRVVLHCFSGDAQVVEHCAERGWFMSFAGNVTFRNAEPLRLAAVRVPEPLLLTETDSPYLTPHPHRGKPNDPSLIPLVLAELARVRGVAPDDLRQVVTDNAHRAFGLPLASGTGKLK